MYIFTVSCCKRKNYQACVVCVCVPAGTSMYLCICRRESEKQLTTVHQSIL
jgi:hypothetical protein